MACVLLSAKVQHEDAGTFKPGYESSPNPDCRKLLGPLFWNIVLQRNITNEQLKEMLQAYQKKLNSQGRVYKHWNIKNDLEAQLRREDMTWKIFCMGLEAIGATDIDIEFSAHFRS